MLAVHDRGRGRYYLVSAGAFVGLGLLGVAGLLLGGHSLLTALIAGSGWALIAQELAWGLAEIVAPGWVIRWRQSAISVDRGWLKRVGQYFSHKVGSVGPEPWKDPIVRRRVRLVGVVLTITSVMEALVIVILLSPLDNLWAALFG